jgi:hypothetical protein
MCDFVSFVLISRKNQISVISIDNNNEYIIIGPAGDF